MRMLIFTLALALPISSLAQNETYQSPIDNKTYVAPGGWKTYSPSQSVAVTHEKVSIAGVRLLQNQMEISSRTSTVELASFIKLAHNAASAIFASYNKPAVLLVQFTCTPGKCPVEVASQGDPPRELLQAYYDKLTQLQPLRTSGEVKFQFTLNVQP